MPDLSTGTVTFLFTDIEGSTALWQAHPGAMPAVIARHDDVLKGLVAEHGGVVFRTVGDAIHAAYGTPADAVRTAIAAQRAIAQEPWPDDIALRVRMGIHTGTVDVRSGEYVGHTLNRVARITAAGHGGQVLLSAATADLVRDALSTDASLRDLGEHRLKDLVLPERVFIVDIAGIPTDPRPLKTVDGSRTNMPPQRGSLVGRRRELEMVRDLLSRDEVRLVTLTGAGGTGKSTLSLAAGHALLDSFQDGVWLIPLASIMHSELVPSAVISALGLREERGQSPLEVLAGHLGAKHALLLLDNFEQITEAAPFVADLLNAAPQLKILVTSRIPLHLREEREVPIEPLSLPTGSADVQSLSGYGAIQLFVERVQAVKPDFALTPENAPAVFEICSRLDGLPLAIELAAARVKILPPQALLARLERRLPLLRGGSHDLPARQQTMESAIAWSYGLLTEEEQRLYRRLSVFGPGFTLEQAETICTPGEGEMDLLEGITSLGDKSLIRSEDAEGEPRFSMLQTIREFGLERLAECGEIAALQSRHAAYFADLAERLERDAYTRGTSHVYGAGQAEWNNFRAALDCSLGVPGDTPTAVRLIAALGWFWIFGQYTAEGRARAAALLARTDVPDTGEAWAGALVTIATLYLQQGNVVEGTRFLTRSEELVRGSENELLLAQVWNWQAIVALNQGDIERARRLFMRTREGSRNGGLRWGEITATSYIAESLVMEGQGDEGRRVAEEAIAGFQDLRDAWGTGRMLVVLAAADWLQGRYDAASATCSNAVHLLQQIGEPYNSARALTLQGIILVDDARYAEAEHALMDALAGWQTIGHEGGVTLCLAGLAATAAGQGQLDRARHLYAALPSRDRPLLLDHLMDTGYGRFLSCIRERLGSEEARSGPPVSLEEAIEIALGAGSVIPAR